MENSITQKVATPQEIKQHKVAATNFLTRNIIGFWFVNHSKGKAQMLIELSEGRGMDGSPIYGITCSNNNESYPELSKLVFSEKEAVEYINSLT